jgi:cytochrome d ubiquinol oxidase subunit II
LLWGVAFANIVRGVPIDAQHEYTGGFFNLLNPYALLGGAVTLTLFLLHGAVFLALKTTGEPRRRARALAAAGGPVVVVLAASFLVWTQLDRGDAGTAVAASLAALALLGSLAANAAGREGRAFALTAVAIAAATATLFLALFPDVMPATDSAFSLTVDNASSTPYTLKVMTWVAVVFTPVVLAYQAWSYWVFRRRLGIGDIPAPPAEAALPRQRATTEAPRP